MALDLRVSTSGDIAIVFCRGRVVFGEGTDELRRVILRLLNETKNIVLNFAWLGQVDCNGLGMLVALFASACDRGATIKFAAPSPAVQKLFTATGLDSLFEIYNSNEDALKSFHPPSNIAA